MLQYLIVLLDDTSTSFCHYDNYRVSKKLIPLETLKKGIRLGMIENLMVQFVYPDYKLPEEYRQVIESIEHTKIVSSLCDDNVAFRGADVVVYHDWDGLVNRDASGKFCVLRTTKEDLFDRFIALKEALVKYPRVSVVLTNIESFKEDDFNRYKQVLHSLSQIVQTLYIQGHSPQLNLLTDRLLLSTMNNCGAGESCITLAPNGKFYICPAFYYEDECDSVGDIENGIAIKNQHLYRIKYAPICSHCDAWQCKRCIWLNHKTTLEVNTPSHEQCVVAHLERSQSAGLLSDIRKHGSFLPHITINALDYLDPFDNRKNW